MTHQGGHGGQSRVYRRSQSLGGGGGRGRGHSKSQSRKEVSPSQNGVGKKVLDDIELLNTEALVQEVSLYILETDWIKIQTAIISIW